MAANQSKQSTTIRTMENVYTKQQMVKEKVQSKKRKLFVRRLILLALIASVVSYIMFATLHSRNKLLAEKQLEQKHIEKQSKQLDATKSTLKDQVKKLNDDDYIAKLARSEYFLSEKGEIIFNIPEDKESNKK